MDPKISVAAVRPRFPLWFPKFAGLLVRFDHVASS
jgi:hypothetical protein